MTRPKRSDEHPAREAFEAWVAAPPYEREVDRQGEADAWPGQYRDYDLQLAWEAWQAGATWLAQHQGKR